MQAAKEGKQTPERVRYHLSPRFRVFMKLFEKPVVRVDIGIHWTDLRGNEIEWPRTIRYRKKLCKSWWNREWLCRQIAIMSLLAGGKGKLIMEEPGDADLIVSGTPIKVECPLGIREGQLKLQKKIARQMLRGEDDDAETE